MTSIQQRTGLDCGVASLAIVLVERVMRLVDPHLRGRAGLYNRELVRAGLACHTLPLTPRRAGRFNLDHDEGVLRLRWKDPARRRTSPAGHYVAVVEGCIHCPETHTVMPWRDYVIRYGAVPVTLLCAPPREP